MIDQNRSVPAEALEAQPEPVERWAALAGMWSFDGAGALYEGPAEYAAYPPLGLALGSQRLKDGCVSANVSLSQNERAAGGILLGYQSPHFGYVTVTLGGWERGYTI